jgi:hypothetical protein
MIFIGSFFHSLQIVMTPLSILMAPLSILMDHPSILMDHLSILMAPLSILMDPSPFQYKFLYGFLMDGRSPLDFFWKIFQSFQKF